MKRHIEGQLRTEERAHMHVGDMPEELRPYAFRLEAQIRLLFDELGVASVAELVQRGQADHARIGKDFEKIRRLKELALQLREVRTAPREYLAKKNRESAPVWIENVQTCIGALPSSGDSDKDQFDMDRLTMRVRQAQEVVTGVPITDEELRTWLSQEDPNDPLRGFAREAADIAIEMKRYTLVLKAFPPDRPDFGDPTPKVVQAMIADGVLDKAERVIKQMRSGVLGAAREAAYFSLAKALQKKGMPWREAYDNGVASYCESEEIRRRWLTAWEESQVKMAGTRARALGDLGCGAEAATVFLSVAHHELERDARDVVASMIDNGAYEAAVDFMKGVGMDADTQRSYRADIARYVLESKGAHSPEEVAQRIADAEAEYAAAENADTKSIIANTLANIYIKQKMWDKVYALLPEFLPKGGEGELLRLAIPFLYQKDASQLDAVVQYAQQHPELQPVVDRVFSQVAIQYLEEGNLRAADEWRARIKDKTKDPWWEYFTFVFHSGDVQEAARMYADMRTRWPEDARLKKAAMYLFEAYIKAGDANAFVDLLRVMPVNEMNPVVERHRIGVVQLMTVLEQARHAAAPRT